MNQPNLILIGAGGHAHSCIDVIEQQGRYQIAGLIGMAEEVGTQHLGYTVMATDADLPQVVKEYQYAIITLGHVRSPERRIQLYRLLTELGFQLPVVVAPTAHVSRHATLGAGTIVMHGAIVNAGATVGSNCIINTRALVEHDVTVEDHCHISTGTVLNGGASVGEGSFIGSSSVIKEGVVIGRGCIVGMGQSVRHNQTDNARFVGDVRL